MNRFRTICLVLTLACSSVLSAQTTGTALLWDVGNGKLIGLVTTADGQMIFLTDATVFKIPPPSPPPSPVQWKVEGLYVLIVDDENQRGNLPQNQVNIFSSRPLRDWLNQNAKAYRFSSNDSLVPGGPARELEQPEFVAGWDLVAAGEVGLPALLVSDGKKQTLEPLPKDADSLIRRLEEFK